MEVAELGLRVVPVESVKPHEHEDPRRVERLASALRKEGWLKNPPLVVEHDGVYVLLDGTTRTHAMASLGYPHILVQVIDPRRARVSTWNHLVIGQPVESFWQKLQSLPLLTYQPLSGAALSNSGHRWAGGLHLADGRVFSIELPPTTQPPEEVEALNRLVATYTGEQEIRRSVKADPAELLAEHPALTAIIAFPQYTVHDIECFGTEGLLVPPGITRCIVPGRILRVNMDLSVLNSRSLTLEQKNLLLAEYLHARLARQPIRYYEEPVYIFED